MSSGIVKKVRPRGRPPKSAQLSHTKIEPLEHVEIIEAPTSPVTTTLNPGSNLIRNSGSMSLRPNKRVRLSKALKRMLESEDEEDEADFEEAQMERCRALICDLKVRRVFTSYKCNIHIQYIFFCQIACFG